MSTSNEIDSASGHSSAGVASARLIVVEGRASKAEVELRLPAVIGRGDQATVLVKHPTVSRAHCEILAAKGALLVRDMNSKNGTYVGAERVVEAVLKPGDQLTVGPLTFRVEYETVASSNGKPPAAKSQREEAPAEEPAKGVTDDDVVSFLFE